MRVMAPRIIVCKEWGARKPKSPPIVTGKPERIIVHHTDSNAGEKPSGVAGNMEQAIAFAKAIQNYHMDSNDWDDTGQNFTVMRSGIILQGRWGTVTAIERGHMVVSAHCPGQNDQPGIEHEHIPGQSMTPEQIAATVHLMAWICDRCKIRPTELYGHRVFYNTDCPDNLMADIPYLRTQVARVLTRIGCCSYVSKAGAITTAAVHRELHA